MSKYLKKFFVLLILFIAFSSGCALLSEEYAKTAGDVDFKYIPGEFKAGVLEKRIKNSALSAYQIVIIALKKMEIPVDQEINDMHSAKVRAKYYDGRSIKIDIKSAKSFECIISIKVGVDGDRAVSEEILTAIMKETAI